MKKYVLFKNVDEVKSITKLYPGCTLDKVSIYPENIKAFGSKEEALEELKKYKTDVTDYGRYYLVEEYYIEEQKVNEEGEVVDSFGIWDYSKMSIYVVSDETKETIGKAGNYKDAEKIADDYYNKTGEYCNYKFGDIWEN